jgi:hypothetical protein
MNMQERIEQERAVRFKRASLRDYLCSQLPQETRTDPTVRAVLNMHLGKEDTTVEACLLDMVRELSKANAEKMNQLMKASELMATSRIEVPR